MDKDTDYIFIGLKGIIRAASDEDTRPFICDLLDRIKLSEKNFVIDRHISISISGISHGIGIHHKGIEETVRWFLVMGFEDLLTDTALFCSTRQHLFVIKLDPEVLRDPPADLSSGTSVLPANCNDRVCFHNPSTLLCIKQSSCDFA